MYGAKGLASVAGVSSQNLYVCVAVWTRSMYGARGLASVAGVSSQNLCVFVRVFVDPPLLEPLEVSRDCRTYFSTKDTKTQKLKDPHLSDNAPLVTASCVQDGSVCLLLSSTDRGSCPEKRGPAPSPH